MVCISHRATDSLSEASFEKLKRQITELLIQNPLSPVEIANKITAEKEEVAEVIRHLLEEGALKMQDGMIHISK